MIEDMGMKALRYAVGQAVDSLDTMICMVIAGDLDTAKAHHDAAITMADEIYDALLSGETHAAVETLLLPALRQLQANGYSYAVMLVHPSGEAAGAITMALGKDREAQATNHAALGKIMRAAAFRETGGFWPGLEGVAHDAGLDLRQLGQLILSHARGPS
jgi:hypothetical protein